MALVRIDAHKQYLLVFQKLHKIEKGAFVLFPYCRSAGDRLLKVHLG